MRDIQQYSKPGTTLQRDYFPQKAVEPRELITEHTNPDGKGRRFSGRDDIHIGNRVTSTPYYAFRFDIHSDRQLSHAGYKLSRGKVISERSWHGDYYSAPTFGSLGGPFYQEQPLLPPGLSGEAANALLKKVQDMKANLATMYGELPSTARMIANNVIFAVYGLKALLRGDLQWYRKLRRKRFGKRKYSNTYLEWIYGWLPLISETGGLIDHFTKTIRDGILSARVVRTRLSSADQVSNYYRTRGKWETGCEMGVTYKVTSPKWLEASQLGLLNPLLLAWELTTLSFVLDWFISVGDFLLGLGATIGLDFLTGYRTEFARSKSVYTEYEALPPLPRNSIVTERYYQKWKADMFAMKRYPLHAWPIPRLTINLGLNTHQLASAVALGRQRT